MLVIFRLFQRDDTYLLRMPSDLLAAIQARLQMYILRSKVALQTLDDWVGIGIAGSEATSLLMQHFGLELRTVNSVAHHDNFTVLRIPGADRYEVYAPVESMQALWPIFSQTLTPANDSSWRLLDIRNGIPTVYTETSEHFVPQMANMQLIDGVSFKKGCYPGQEVVARMQHLGKLKRRLYHVQIQSNEAPAPGTGIVSFDRGEVHEAGEIVDAISQSATETAALAVLPIADINLPLHLNDANGPQLELLDLPYSFPEDVQKNGC
jgi:folate-binding protein YgfZ